MLHIPIISVVVCIQLVTSQIPSNSEYCDEHGSSHTMCTPAPGSACGDEYEQYVFSASEIDQILEYHNNIRNITAGGLETKTKKPLPPACSMCELQWHEEAAAIAQRHTDHCKYGHDCGDCRDLIDESEHSYCGQNVALSRYSAKPNTPPMQIFLNLIDLWYSTEVHLFGPEDIYPFVFNYAYGHYSQLIWSKTCYIGCGASIYYDGKRYNYFVACNYCHGGNYGGQAVYDVHCRNSPSYSNLCLP
ncbi:UNVERIFIED_CONTAM: hypothetical protein RMT77_001145 [Armadillidium vulgare]